MLLNEHNHVVASNYNYDQNSKIIQIPNDVFEIDEECFKDYIYVEKIIIPESVNIIAPFAFQNCKNLKQINLPDNLQLLSESAFEDCISLEEITIPKNISCLAENLFKNDSNLKHIYFKGNITCIDYGAFYNCANLEDFILPDTITNIGAFAFFGCHKIKNIFIPKTLEHIEVAAFSYIKNLETIEVDEDNPRYFSEDDNTVLMSKDGLILQYAINSKKEEFIVGYYTDTYKLDTPVKYSSLTYDIADYAFAGASNLKKLYIPSELNSIGINTFFDCPNLKNLKIFFTPYGQAFGINFFNIHQDKVQIPFEKITIEEGITTLCGGLSSLFQNAKSITLPESLECINEDVFLLSKDLKTLKIPKNIKIIEPSTFYSNITLNFPFFQKLKAKDFKMLQTKNENEDEYISKNKNGDIKIFALENGCYYVQIGDYDVVKISQKEIAKLSKTSKELVNNPDDVIIHIMNLLTINAESSRVLTKIWTDKELCELFENFVSNCDYIKQLTTHKISKIIKLVLDKSGKYDELLFNKMIMIRLSKKDIIKILNNYNNSIDRFIKNCTQNDIKPIEKFINYCNLLEKYQVRDKLLYNSIFYNIISFDLQEKLIKHYNKNIKRLLIKSNTLDDKSGWNLNDLLKLCKLLGVFSDDKIISQRAATFISDNLFSDKYNITGDNIHTIFTDIKELDENKEFLIFFIENFDKLIELEKEKNGIISRIANYFTGISCTSTSHRGSQRHLKVTLDKCIDFFLTDRFEGVTEENKDLALLLQNFYSENYSLTLSEKIYKQSLNAPRNIFSKVEYNENGTPIYSYDESEDLKESGNEYNYEWLPKQDYRNLILGKYCSCCAHILGAGAGIMRASMITDYCQNLVIKNNEDKIIAKMTIYVNRDEGYAVYNTTEININYSFNQNELYKIYCAFLRGTNAFLDVYNKNNSIPIKIVTIGEYRNQLKEYFSQNKVPLYKTPNYSTFGYYFNNKNIGTYDGDCKEKQLLVTKK